MEKKIKKKMKIKVKPMYPEVPLRIGGMPFASGMYPSTGYAVDKKKMDKDKNGGNFTKNLPAPAISLLCPYDSSLLSFSGYLETRGPKGTLLSFPIYVCDRCKKEYSSLPYYKDMSFLQCQNKRFINIHPDKIDMDKRPERNPKMKCWLCSDDFLHACPQCHCHTYKVFLKVENDNGYMEKQEFEYCRKCKMIIAPYTIYNTHKAVFKFLNGDRYEELVETVREKKEEKRRKDEQKRQEKKKRKNEKEASGKGYDSKDIPSQISIVDLVVKTNTFRCMHNKHALQNIIASVDVLTKDGEEKKMNVSAGYCPECKSFFIMESTYEAIKRKGIPLCKICDEKSFISSTSSNGMLLAQESVLMQYGYNVNQNEGLSPKTRQHILAILIDNGIATNSEIISYLNFFISQRQNQEKYKVAIRKWETDRFFVENYFSGDLKRYGINKIYRS